MKTLRRILNASVYLIALLAIIAVLIPSRPLFEIPVRAEFSKQVSITGGSPAPRLVDSLSIAGYTGGAQMDELTICDPAANGNSFYLGSSSSVNASTGFEIPIGVCVTYRSGQRAIDSSRIYLFTAATQSAAVTLRER